MKNQKHGTRPSFFYTVLAIAHLALSVHQAHGAHIIFDLNGVLISSNYEQALHQFGLTKKEFLWYILTGNSPRTRMFQLFDALQPHLPGQPPACDEHGTLLPQLMLDWQQGTFAPEQIREQTLTYCATHPNFFSSTLEKKIITRMMSTMFTPEKFACMQQWNPEGLALVHECKKHGHTLYILSNWDAQTFAVMYTNPYFKTVFDLFDGIVISGAIHMIKPDPAIYQHLLTRYALDPAQCIFIDDQLVNVRAARTEGIYSIWCRPVRSLTKPWSTYPDFAYVHSKLAAREQTLTTQEQIPMAQNSRAPRKQQVQNNPQDKNNPGN